MLAIDDDHDELPEGPREEGVDWQDFLWLIALLVIALNAWGAYLAWKEKKLAAETVQRAQELAARALKASEQVKATIAAQPSPQYVRNTLHLVAHSDCCWIAFDGIRVYQGRRRIHPCAVLASGEWDRAGEPWTSPIRMLGGAGPWNSGDYDAHLVLFFCHAEEPTRVRLFSQGTGGKAEYSVALAPGTYKRTCTIGKECDLP
jgi:hypothetical protein